MQELDRAGKRMIDNKHANTGGNQPERCPEGMSG
jgi:hypothetical protein